MDYEKGVFEGYYEINEENVVEQKLVIEGKENAKDIRVNSPGKGGVEVVIFRGYTGVLVEHVDLPNLKTIVISDKTLMECKEVVFEGECVHKDSHKDLPKLESITIGSGSLALSGDNTQLVMKSWYFS